MHKVVHYGYSYNHGLTPLDLHNDSFWFIYTYICPKTKQKQNLLLDYLFNAVY